MGKYDGKKLVYRVNGVIIGKPSLNPRSMHLDNFEQEWRASLGSTGVNSAVSITRDDHSVTVVTNEDETLVLSIE